MPLPSILHAQRIEQLLACLGALFVQHVEDLHFARPEVFRPASITSEFAIGVDPLVGQAVESLPLELLTSPGGHRVATVLAVGVVWQSHLVSTDCRQPSSVECFARVFQVPLRNHLGIGPALLVSRVNEPPELRAVDNLSVSGNALAKCHRSHFVDWNAETIGHRIGIAVPIVLSHIANLGLRPVVPNLTTHLVSSKTCPASSIDDPSRDRASPSTYCALAFLNFT